MNSLKIAEYFEEKHPSPSLHLDSPYIDKVVSHLSELMQLGTGLRGAFLGRVPDRLLSDKSIGYWHETRCKALGKPVNELTEDEQGEKAWANSAQNIQAVTSLLKENDGPFFMGETVSYADFYWAGFLLFWKRVGDDVFKKLLENSGDEQVHLNHLEAVEPWSKRDDH
jgi:glutathione S-transferase